MCSYGLEVKLVDGSVRYVGVSCQVSVCDCHNCESTRVLLLEVRIAVFSLRLQSLLFPDGTLFLCTRAGGRLM